MKVELPEDILDDLKQLNDQHLQDDETGFAMHCAHICGRLAVITGIYTEQDQTTIDEEASDG